MRVASALTIIFAIWYILSNESVLSKPFWGTLKSCFVYFFNKTIHISSRDFKDQERFHFEIESKTVNTSVIIWQGRRAFPLVVHPKKHMIFLSIC